MELQNVSFAFVWRFHLQNSQNSTDRKWCLFAIQKITKAMKSFLQNSLTANETIFASRWRVFIKKVFFKNPHNSAAWNYRTWVLRLSHVFIFIIHLIQQTGSDACLRFEKITKAIFATPTKQFLLADEEFSSKNPNNWAAWNYRTWVLRLSHVFIFIIHLIQQTGSDVCLRFKR